MKQRVYEILYRWRRISCIVHPVMLAEDYANGKTATRL